MKRNGALIAAILSITVLSIAVPSPSQQSPNTLITVLNPAVANRLAERLPLAPRLGTLQNKTIYMVDINWGGPEAALSIFEEMQGWFARNMPTVKTVIRMKRGGYETDDPALWKEIKENGGSAVILGVSG